jgi:metal iron transporter
MTRLRVFEMFVAALVLGVVICFCVELAYIKDTSVGHVFKGYLPSSAVVNGNGIYLSCGILGATVMPHSIFLGSGIVQSRLRDFDIHNGSASSNPEPITLDDEGSKYRPSLSAIKSCLNYSILELATCLFTFALFVNSAILIVAGASLYNNSTAANADLFGIHALLSSTLTPVAGTIFGIALLLSGTSAGIICTMAGQMVSEGMLNWSISPWLRRFITRSISIVPSIIIAGAVGKEGLNRTLTASQVVLSVILPFVTAPLIYFTCLEKFMTVQVYDASQAGEGEENGRDILRGVNMKNGWIVTLFAVLIWIVLVVMNVALLVLVGLGKA